MTDDEPRTIELTRTEATALLWSWHIGEGLHTDCPLDCNHDYDNEDDERSPAQHALDQARTKLAEAFNLDIPR